jgi:hypothetical protein
MLFTAGGAVLTQPQTGQTKIAHLLVLQLGGAQAWGVEPYHLDAAGRREAMLKHLKRVFIQFHPSDAKATPARELLALVGNDKARKSNPDCVVDYKVIETAQIPRSFIELQFADNEQHKLYTADLKVCACCCLCFACCSGKCDAWG